ncbi:MAG: flagellar biosynthesis protein P, partial [Myxococcales bacterium]|nr:flagellar biosynthesis protein P [Myxococcales bacterium]
RYGHDDQPGVAGTTIPGDMSGIVDGQALDVHWYDPQGIDKSYFDCNGQEIIDSLAATPPPLCPGGPGNCAGIGTWTKGALDFTAALVAQSKSDHPDDLVPGDERFYGIMVITDGAWTSAVGFPQLSPPEENPAITAGSLFDQQGIPTYVVAVAEAATLPFADELAAAGGTGESIAAANPNDLFAAMGAVVQDIADQVVVPECTAGLPRVMVLLDGSSSMLNVGELPGGPGQTGWDRARAALASGDNSLFDVEVVSVGRPVEDLIHLGLAVFGADAPAEEKLLVQYGPCMQDNFAWALDPTISCEQPGCDDPWGGPPITWTFKDGSIENPPAFSLPTVSHMPSCTGNNNFCTGSGTYTNLGMQLIKNNQQQYHQAAQLPNAHYPANGATQYINILITDGAYLGYASDAQVQAEIEAMFNAGIVTWVVGYGDGVDSPGVIAKLELMADWGSGGANDYLDANNQVELEMVLTQLVSGLDHDPCCVTSDCYESPIPTADDEPDPLPPVDTTDTTASDTTTDTAADTGDTTGDS